MAVSYLEVLFSPLIVMSVFFLIYFYIHWKEDHKKYKKYFKIVLSIKNLL